MVTRLRVEEKNDINLYLIGDIHAGAKTCDKKSLLKTV